MKIIIDTNFMIIPGEFNVDIFSQMQELDSRVQFFVVEHTLKELKKITQTGKGKEKSAAKLALQLIADRVTILPHHEEPYADDEILHHAKEGYAVATLDKAFKERLKSHKIKVITLRQKKYIILQ